MKNTTKKTTIKTPNKQAGESLQNRAMLCSLSITLPGQTKTDKRATEKLTTEASAQKDSARVQKKIWSGKSMSNLINCQQNARNWFYSITSPWGDEGTRILSNELYLKAVERFNGIKESFVQHSQEFSDSVQSHIDLAKESNGDLFNEADYPNTAQILDKCTMNLRLYPLNISDWRISSLNDGEKARLEQENADLMNDAKKVVKQDLAERLGKPLKHFLEKLQADKGKLHKSSLVKVRESIEMAGLMNVDNDKDIKELCDTINDQTRDMSIETIRENSARRADAEEKTKGLLDKLSSDYGI